MSHLDLDNQEVLRLILVGWLDEEYGVLRDSMEYELSTTFLVTTRTTSLSYKSGESYFNLKFVILSFFLMGLMEIAVVVHSEVDKELDNFKWYR